MNKTYYLKGDVCRTGPIEIVPGTTLRQIIDGLGGGMANGKAFKAMQIGGPSGGLVGPEQLDLPLDMKELAPYGVRRGDGVLNVLDEDRCVVDTVYRFVKATQAEFCGKCVSCREGTRRMSELMDRLTHCALSREDFTLLTDLGEMVSVTSFCALGKNCFHTLEGALKLFPEEFEAHLSGHCPRCEAETRLAIVPGHLPHDRKQIVIDPEKCRGCSRCSRACHAQAISGVIKSPFHIDQSVCVKCYTCMDLCAFGAIREVEVDG